MAHQQSTDIRKQFTDGSRDSVGSTTARQRHRVVSTVAPIGGGELAHTPQGRLPALRGYRRPSVPPVSPRPPSRHRLSC